MKKTTYILAVAVMMTAMYGCDSYLDRQPDDQLTSENIFDKKTSTWKYLVNVYSFMLDEDNQAGNSNGSIAVPASDEASCAYTGGRFFATWTHGQASPLTTHTFYRSAIYKNQYRGISEATYFMSKVGDCPELTEDEIRIWKAEARFMRAYYYTELLKWNGPVIFLGDKAADYTDPTLSSYDRSPWSTIVDWLCDEYDEAAADLPRTWGSNDLGRATRGAALAMKDRLLLFNASPLFNGQNGTGMYDNIINNYGEKLFNTTYDESLWKKAADACKEVIDLGQYSLVDDDDKTPLENIHEAFVSLNSPENIFVMQVTGRAWRVCETPSGLKGSGYGGLAPTQKLVDAFAMENGYYPIDNMEEEDYQNGGGVIKIDERSGYKEEGHQAFVNPFFSTIPSTAKQTSKIETMNMYIGREPRFYANIFWSGQTWIMGSTAYKDVKFYTNGSSGPRTSNNYPPTGYLCLKFVNPDLDTGSNSWGNISWPMIRYADVLLMYVEALNEYDPTNPDIITYWNMIRKRAGIPLIGDGADDVYGEIIGDKELQRKYIRRERMVEFCFEGKRYFDTRRWMIAEQEDNGDVYGMNVASTNHTIGGEFWKRTSVFDCYGEGGFMTLRSFTKKNYLLPINQEEIDRVPEITQNYGWD